MNRKIVTFALLFFFTLSPALAAEFDEDYLISDTEMTDYNAMNFQDISAFLEHQPGTLKNYITVDKEGNLKSANQTFYEVGQNWMINPKYLMVLVQKEMSLLNDTAPKQSQYDWATGYGCFDNQSCDERFMGFYKQVNSAAAQTRYYMDNINEFKYQPGKTSYIDGIPVTPKNIATAGLYAYTPHIHGNQLFWNLWNQYFGKKWPDGTLLQASSTDAIYLISGDKKREITSKAVFASRFDIKKVIAVSDDELTKYDNGVPVKYLNFSLLAIDPETTTAPVYMIVDDQKRLFTSRDLMKKIGLNEDEILPATQEELNLYVDGPNITQYTLFPAGALIQDSVSKDIFYVLNGKRKPVVNKEILDYNFPGMPIKKMTPLEMENYPIVSPVTLPDGELIKTKKINTVYVIAGGKRMPIFNSTVFKNMKYSWSNVKIVSDETLAVHPLGQTITGEW